MAVHKMSSSVNNHCSIWWRISFPWFRSWVDENKSYQCTNWVGVCENELSPHRLNLILMLPEKFIKGLPMNSPLIKERWFSWKAKRYLEFRDISSCLEERRNRIMDKAGWLQLTKPQTFQPPNWVPVCYLSLPSSKSTLLSSAVWFWGKLFPTVPGQRVFYLIPPIGGTRGRLEGEKREGPSLSSSCPWEPLPAVAVGCSHWSLLAFPGAVFASCRGSSSSWLEPFLSTLSANSTGLLLWACVRSYNPWAKGS